MIAALTALGDVDVFLLVHRSQSLEVRPPDGVPVARTGGVHRPEPRHGRRSRIRWWIAGRLPLQLDGVDFSAVREAFTHWTGDYDLAWFVQPDSLVALGDLVACPSILDLYDLHAVIQRPRTPDWPAPGRAGGDGTVAAWKRGRLTARNAGLWEALERRLAPQVAAVAVCSEADRDKLGVPNAVVVPNGIDIPPEPAGRRGVSDPPTLFFHGSLGYAPNSDAAERLVEDVAPLVRDRLPRTLVRLVGSADGRVERLHDPPRVVVTGPVDDMVEELRSADVLAAPLRYGGGTKIKVLEALAHGIPVVTTSVGAEGLGVEHGRHLLVADEPHAFADACVRMLTDEGLRASVADEGMRLVAERFSWDRIHEIVRRVAREVASVPADGVVGG